MTAEMFEALVETVAATDARALVETARVALGRLGEESETAALLALVGECVAGRRFTFGDLQRYDLDTVRFGADGSLSATDRATAVRVVPVDAEPRALTVGVRWRVLADWLGRPERGALSLDAGDVVPGERVPDVTGIVRGEGGVTGTTDRDELVRALRTFHTASDDLPIQVELGGLDTLHLAASRGRRVQSTRLRFPTPVAREAIFGHWRLSSLRCLAAVLDKAERAAHALLTTRLAWEPTLLRASIVTPRFTVEFAAAPLREEG